MKNKVVNCVWLTDFQDGYKIRMERLSIITMKQVMIGLLNGFTTILTWGFDGIDVDMEPGIIYNQQQIEGLLKALFYPTQIKPFFEVLTALKLF